MSRFRSQFHNLLRLLLVELETTRRSLIRIRVYEREEGGMFSRRRELAGPLPSNSNTSNALAPRSTPPNKEEPAPPNRPSSLPSKAISDAPQTRLRLVVRLLGTLAQRAFGCVAKHAGKGRSWPPLCSAFVSCDLAFKALLLGEEKVSSAEPGKSRSLKTPFRRPPPKSPDHGNNLMDFACWGVVFGFFESKAEGYQPSAKSGGRGKERLLRFLIACSGSRHKG